MNPQIVVLSGGVALERAASLIRGMVNAPPNLDGFGGILVDLIPFVGTLSAELEIIQPFLKQFKLPDTEDPGFDERIMLEAIRFAARMFRESWNAQVPHLSIQNYRFNRWMGTDLVVERR